MIRQNATSLRKSAPGPPNSSDEHVSCTAPATENASLQILFKCPTPACTLLTRCSIPCACHAKRYLNIKKWSEYVVFWTLIIYPSNVLRATTACTFSTSQLPTFWSRNASQRRALFLCITSQLLKVVRCWGVLYILTSTCASRHNSVQFFISHLASWLRTRRFSEPTFRPSRATNHWKNIVFRDFPTFSRTWIFFLLTLSLSSSLLFADSSHLCFSSVHIVGSLTSKLLSIISVGFYFQYMKKYSLGMAKAGA